MSKRRRNAFFKLKSLRVEFNITQIDMAKKLGIAESSYILKENGYREFTLMEAEIVASIFNKTINDVFFARHVDESLRNILRTV